MPTATTFLARARTNAQDWLIEADEPLAGFHRRCGGELPGPIVAPALLELVRKARLYGFRLARELRAVDDREAVSAWIEIDPDADGCSLTVNSWHVEELDGTEPEANDAGRIALAQHMAELCLRLGPAQEILALDCFAPELDALAARMREGKGRPWTDFVALAGNSHRQPLHWRLLDGAKATLEGSDRLWTATIVPLGVGEPGSAGFELYLVADEPPLRQRKASKDSSTASSSFGPEIAPVLRQPISRIIANAETIRAQLAGPLAEEYSAYARDISTAGEHLLALVEDLTALELVEAEDFSPEPDQIDLADIARRAGGILSMRAQEKGISVDLPREDETAPAIGEFRRVLQILLNLLGNAIRYAPERSQIWLRVAVENGRARITVADQGEGLDQDEQARIFNKFERLGRDGDGGSGLGLYISRRLAQAMGGSLSVESAKGQGARFTLELRADQAAN